MYETCLVGRRKSQDLMASTLEIQDETERLEQMGAARPGSMEEES